MYEAPQPRRHAKGVLPVCRRMCACMFHFFENGFRQPGTLHVNIFCLNLPEVAVDGLAFSVERVVVAVDFVDADDVVVL